MGKFPEALGPESLGESSDLAESSSGSSNATDLDADALVERLDEGFLWSVGHFSEARSGETGEGFLGLDW